MLTPYSWLKDYVKTDAPPETLAERMIMTGNALERMTKQGEDIVNVVVGRITKLERHPDADKLVVGQVDVGEGRTVQIVTGADNVFEGALIPCALDGAQLPGGVKIKKGKLRGVESHGMMCSGEELRLSEEDHPGAGVYGILILKEGTPGQDIRSLLGMDDTIFEFEVGANRPDCLSILGVAREAAAAMDVPVEIPVPTYTPCDGDVSEYVRVTVADPELCPRYMARAVRNVRIAPSPQWMQDRLKAAGVRPISNIVDITNFVMLETGQPMHAFDAADIHGDHIIVRRAHEGETMTTLDGKERRFTGSMLLITDEAGPIGIGGVMGGENSEIKDTTSTVIFESANFVYGNIRQTSRGLGLSTESAMRYSKGVDPHTTELAIDRACQLVELLGAGEVVGGTIDICAADLSPRSVTVCPDGVNALLGTALSAEQMAALLNRVSIPTELSEGALVCRIPYYRGDVAGPADVAEEIARIYGYDNIPLTPMRLSVRKGDVSDPERVQDRLKAVLADAGFFECLSYSFMGEADFDRLGIAEDAPERNAVRIKNPLGSDSGLMRTTLLPGMLTAVATNLNRKNDALRLFEVGRAFFAADGSVDIAVLYGAIEAADGDRASMEKCLPMAAKALPSEEKRVILAVVGEDEDFFTLKGCVENAAAALGLSELAFTAGGPDWLHPGRKALISCRRKPLGWIGEIHPDVLERYDIGRRVYAAELPMEALGAGLGTVVKHKPLPKYPAAERDLAVVVDMEAESGAIRACILKSGGNAIESAELFDVYTGEKLGGRKSLAYSLRFRRSDRTMTDDEVTAAMAKILAALEKQFGAELRA